MGWILAPHAVREKLVIATEAQILCPSAFAQAAVNTYLSTMPWREQLKTYREIYRERRDAMLEALDAMMPEGTTWTRPGGGMFVWATLPDGLDAKAMLPRALTARVAYVPGIGFYADGDGTGNLRLNFSFAPRSGSGKGSAGSPAWWSRSCRCARCSASSPDAGTGGGRPRCSTSPRPGRHGPDHDGA